MKMQNVYYKTDTSHYAHCRSLMQKFHYHRIARFSLLAVTMFANCYFHVITLPIFYHEMDDPTFGLWWGMFAYLINIVISITAFCTKTENLRLLLLLLILILLGTIIGFLHPAAGIALGVLYLTQLPDCFQMRWVQEQQGYPYFNERYQLQKDYKNYTSQFIQETEQQEARRKANQNEIVVFSMPDQQKHQ